MLALLTAALVTTSGSTITLDPIVYSAIGGVLIPVLTALVTKLNASGGVKATVALFLAAVLGVATTIQQQGSTTFDWKIAVMSVLSAFLTAGSSYNHLWKPAGDTDTVPGALATKNFGLGGSKIIDTTATPLVVSGPAAAAPTVGTVVHVQPDLTGFAGAVEQAAEKALAEWAAALNAPSAPAPSSSPFPAGTMVPPANPAQSGPVPAETVLSAPDAPAGPVAP